MISTSVSAPSTTALPRVLVTLKEDLQNDPEARVKYGYFLDALIDRFPFVKTVNVSLPNVGRMLNTLLMFHPNPRQWNRRRRMNVLAFRERSKRATAQVARCRGQIDLILQIGVRYDARWKDISLPSVIYTDYTSRLSMRKPDSTPLPLVSSERAKWFALESGAFERASHICTRSKFVRASLIEDYGIQEEKVTAIGGGVNLRKLPEIDMCRQPGPPTVLFIGKNFYRKGGDLILEAFARVRREMPDARLLFLCLEPVPSHFSSEGVELIPPTWDRQQISNLYRRADVFVLPSRLETWGDVLLEAMAHCLPCVGVAGEAMEEIVENGVTGIVVGSNSVDELRDALLTLFKSGSLRAAMGAAGRKKVEEQFTWHRVVERLSESMRIVLSSD